MHGMELVEGLWVSQSSYGAMCLADRSAADPLQGTISPGGTGRENILQPWTNPNGGLRRNNEQKHLARQQHTLLVLTAVATTAKLNRKLLGGRCLSRHLTIDGISAYQRADDHHKHLTGVNRGSAVLQTSVTAPEPSALYLRRAGPSGRLATFRSRIGENSTALGSTSA